MGLYDAILIKNNHITAAGGVAQALKNVASSGLPVEIEVCSFEELEQALTAGAKHLLLDNFNPGRVREAVAKIAGQAKSEISGGVTLENVRTYAETGADYVSAGAITHSARAVDISFRLGPSSR
jgi:nicotinate-nucleotide pyrophosphorylase (carboxylating)